MQLVANDNFTLTASNNVDATSLKGDVNINASNELSAFALSGPVAISACNNSLDLFAAHTMQLVANDNFTLTASNNVDATSLKGDVNINASNELSVFALSGPVAISACNNSLDLFAAHTMQLVANDNVTLTASNNVDVTSLKDSVNINASNELSAFALSGPVAISACNNMLEMYSKGVMQLTTSNVFTLGADSDVGVSSLHGNVNILANTNFTTSATGIALAATSSIGMSTFSFSNLSSNAVIFGSNLLQLSSCNTINVLSSNNLNLSACNTLSLDAQYLNFDIGSDINFSANSNINFTIRSSPEGPSTHVFQVSGSNVVIKGDMTITGSINSSNSINTTIYQHNLAIQDKQIMLASTNSSSFSNEAPPIDGFQTNNGAGIIVEGLPTGFSLSNDTTQMNAAEYGLYSKSILWNYGDNYNGEDAYAKGCLNLGSPQWSNESFWEVKGGSFRITNQRLDANNQPLNTSFGFRINKFDQLELIKISLSNGMTSYKRLAMFGASVTNMQV